MDKLSRLSHRRDAAFDEGNYYEAHQISRTIYNRLLSSPDVETSSVLRFLFETCVRLVDVGELTSALDLGELFVNTLISGLTDDGDVEAGRVLDEFVTLFSHCPPTPLCDEQSPDDDSGEGRFDPLVERRNRILNRILHWTTAKANAAADAQRLKNSQPPPSADAEEAAKSASAPETRKEAEMDLD